MPANTDGDEIANGDVYRALADLGRLIDAIVADDRLSDAEISFLAQWLEASKAIADVPPASTIHRRIGEMLHDGVLSGEEKERLLAELKVHAASAPVVSGG
jgi:hypothetical protein